MDFNNMLLSSLLLYGRYDTKRVHRSEWRVYMNYTVAIVQLVTSAKLLPIILSREKEDQKSILFYLIDFYIINSSVQFAFYLGCMGVHFGIFLLYLEWGRLSSDPRRMHHLRMFFMPNLRQLCKEFDLDIRPARRFVRRANLSRRIMFVVVIGTTLILFGLTIRCIIESYWRLPFEHFLFIACPFAAITLFGYIFLAYAFLGTYLLALLTMDFLVLRATSLSEKITKKFYRIPIRYAGKERDTVVLLKERKQLMRILRTLNDIVKQFKMTNDIFDPMISATFVSCLLGALIYPMFTLLDMSVFLKVTLMILYLVALGNNCFVISIFNDSFITKVSSRCFL